MHTSMSQQAHQERPGVPILCSPSADYAVVPTSSTFSAINLLRNYRLLDLVTNPSHELLYPIHQSLMTSGSCPYRDCGVSTEIYNRDSTPLASTTKRILLAEDSASSPSPPAPPSSASSAATSFNAPLALPAGLQRRSATSGTSERRSDSILPAIHRPAFVNVGQRFPDHSSFTEPEVNGARGFYVGDAGPISGGRSRRPRSEKRPIPDEQKDDKYYERRKRNNQAAKKSRDARKIREDHIALRATMLEHENAILRTQILSLREEAQSLRRMLIEQQMPTMTARYVMDCPRSSLPPSASSATAPRRNVASVVAESSSNRSSFFSRPASKIPTTLFI